MTESVNQKVLEFFPAGQNITVANKAEHIEFVTSRLPKALVFDRVEFTQKYIEICVI